MTTTDTKATTMNTIRLNATQRNALHVQPGDTVAFTDGFGTNRKAKVKRALRHQMASGTHTATHAPCEVHDGPSPRPERVKVSSVERRRVASHDGAEHHDDGANMNEHAYATLTDDLRFKSQGFTTSGDRFEYVFATIDNAARPRNERVFVGHSERSRATYAVLTDASFIGGTSDGTWAIEDVERLFVDTDQTWRVTGRVVTTNNDNGGSNDVDQESEPNEAD